MESDKVCAYDTKAETPDAFSFLVELSESDLFFEEKKKLLQEKALYPKQLVCTESFSSTDSLDITFKRLLQRERIVQLDEAELYFVGADDITQIDSYSPRNELVALNRILSMINDSISSGTYMGTNGLDELRNITLDRICQFGEENSVESKIVESFSCDKEKSLVQWGESNGVKTKLQIAYVEGAGRGAIAVEKLNVGDIALEVPVSVIISEQRVHESDMFRVLEKIDGISSETMLLLWSMREKHNHCSKFKLYFDSLPANFNTGLSFGIDAIVALEGTLLLDEIMQAKEHLHTQYDQLFPMLCNDHPDIFPSEFYSWEQFLWACELWYSNGMRVMFTDGKLRTCLVPIGGFLNHSLCPHVMNYGKIDSATNSLKFPMSRPCHIGEQCFLSYGKLSSSHLVTFYGFLLHGNNPYDVIPLDTDAAEDDYSNDDSHMSNWTTHMVRGTWLSKNHDIFHYGLPSPLLDFLRKAISSTLHNKTLTRENLETEKEVLQYLLSTFDNMMESLGDSKYEDRKDTSWDVKLAVDSKDMQRTIVSSVVTSCLSGLKIVENELSSLEH